MTILSRSLLKKSWNRKLKIVQSMQVSTWLGDIAFHLLLFCLQTLVAIVQSMQVSRWLWDFAFHLLLFWLQTLVAIDSGSYQRLFPSFCVEWFNWVLKICPKFQVLVFSHFWSWLSAWYKKCAKKKYFNSKKSPIYVKCDKRFAIKNSGVLVWPWYLTWTIWEWNC